MTTRQTEDPSNVGEQKTVENGTTEAEKKAAQVFLQRLAQEDHEAIAEWKSNKNPQQQLIDLVKMAKPEGSSDLEPPLLPEFFDFARDAASLSMARAIKLASFLAGNSTHEKAFKRLQTEQKERSDEGRNSEREVEQITAATSGEALEKAKEE